MRDEFGVVGAVERAMLREAHLQGASLRRGLGSLKTFSAISVMVGTVGMLDQFWLRAFASFDGPRSMLLARTADAITDSLSLIGLGLAVSIVAFVFHSYLSGCAEVFDGEMNLFPAQSEPRRAFRMGGMPLFNFAARMHPFGVAEMIWPSVARDADGEAVLSSTMAILFACGAISMFSCLLNGYVFLGLSLVMVFGLGGLAVKRGSRITSFLMSVFFALAAVICFRTHSWITFSALLVVAVLMLGSVRVAWTTRHRSAWILNALLLSAIAVFGWFGLGL